MALSLTPGSLVSCGKHTRKDWKRRMSLFAQSMTCVTTILTGNLQALFFFTCLLIWILCVLCHYYFLVLRLFFLTILKLYYISHNGKFFSMQAVCLTNVSKIRQRLLVTSDWWIVLLCPFYVCLKKSLILSYSIFELMIFLHLFVPLLSSFVMVILFPQHLSSSFSGLTALTVVPSHLFILHIF